MNKIAKSVVQGTPVGTGVGIRPETLDLEIDDLYELSSPPDLIPWAEGRGITGNVSMHIRRLRPYVSAWEADIAYIETLKTALTNLLHLAEQDEIQIEEEWGDGMTLEEMEAAGELAKEIVLARAVLAAEEKKP
jgi:hypothetical protein